MSAWGRKYLANFGVNRRYGLGSRWMILKGGDTIEVANSRVILASSPHIDTGEVEVRTMSGEIILDTRKERRNSY